MRHDLLEVKDIDVSHVPFEIRYLYMMLGKMRKQESKREVFPRKVLFPAEHDPSTIPFLLLPNFLLPQIPIILLCLSFSHRILTLTFYTLQEVFIISSVFSRRQTFSQKENFLTDSWHLFSDYREINFIAFSAFFFKQLL